MNQEDERTQHNKTAFQIVANIIKEFPDITNRLIVLESIVVGVLGSLPLKPGGDMACLQILRDGASTRLADYRLRKITPRGPE